MLPVSDPIFGEYNKQKISQLATTSMLHFAGSRDDCLNLSTCWPIGEVFELLQQLHRMGIMFLKLPLHQNHLEL
jgi:hypothetical protein